MIIVIITIDPCGHPPHDNTCIIDAGSYIDENDSCYLYAGHMRIVIITV